MHFCYYFPEILSIFFSIQLSNNTFCTIAKTKKWWLLSLFFFPSYIHFSFLVFSFFLFFSCCVFWPTNWCFGHYLQDVIARELHSLFTPVLLTPSNIILVHTHKHYPCQSRNFMYIPSRKLSCLKCLTLILFSISSLWNSQKLSF